MPDNIFSFLFSRIDTYVFIGVFLLILVGFLKQFGLLNAKGVRYAVLGILGFLGWRIISDYFGKKKDADFKKREEELEQKEKERKKTKEELEAAEKEAQLAADKIKEVEKQNEENEKQRKKLAEEKEAEFKRREEEAKKRARESSLLDIGTAFG